jgi:hypothetical protein
MVQMRLVDEDVYKGIKHPPMLAKTNIAGRVAE